MDAVKVATIVPSSAARTIPRYPLPMMATILAVVSSSAGISGFSTVLGNVFCSESCPWSVVPSLDDLLLFNSGLVS